MAAPVDPASTADAGETGGGGQTGGDGPAGGDSGGAGAAYAAAMFVGGYNRLVITKWDAERRLCFRVQLTQSYSPSALPLELPARWGVERAGVTAATDACDLKLPLPIPATRATGGSGHVRFTGGMPCTVDVDVELVFDPPAPGGPARERLIRPGLTVRNC